MDQEGLLFPKSIGKKKKRMKHPRSIIQSKESRTCYLCVTLNDNWNEYRYLEEHHLYPGKPDRRLSEEYGLKVYLCHLHHRNGPDAVHNNQDIMEKLQAAGQKIFEETYPDKDFIEIFKKNYKEEES